MSSSVETTLIKEPKTIIKSTSDMNSVVQQTQLTEDNADNANNADNADNANYENDNNLEQNNESENSLLNLIYGNIKNNLEGVNIELSSVMLYTARTMEFVENFNKKSNNTLDKKALVVSTIHKLLDETTNIADFELDFIKFMLDGIIESMIKTSSKEINIGYDNKKYKISKKNKLSINQIIDELHARCNIVIKENKYDADNILINIPVMVGMVMSLIEQFKYLNGTEKKAIIVRVIKKLLLETIPKTIQIKAEDEHKINILNTILPDLVDILIEVANHKYEINTTENCIKMLIKKLSCKKNSQNLN